MPPVVQPKKKPAVSKSAGYIYSPETFQQFVVPNFHMASCANELLDNIKPAEFYGSKLICIDTETHPYYQHSHLVPQGHVRRWVGTGKQAVPQDFPFCVSVCDGTNAYTLFDSYANDFKEFDKLRPLLEDPSIDKTLHNAKFDMHQFANIGMKILGRIHDSVISSKLVDENKMSYELKELAAKMKGGIVVFEHMVYNYKQMNRVTDYRNIPRELLNQYANADVHNGFLLEFNNYPRLIADDLLDLYNNELELMIALFEMERHGMRVDTEYEKPLKDELQQLTNDAETTVYETTGRMFNMNSNQQLYDVLIAHGVNDKWIQKTDKGNPTLDKKALERLADVHNVEIVQKILEFRKYEKLLGTYAYGIYEQMDSLGYVHGSINQTEATTGRMSITKPALQTLPKKDKRIRRMFLPDDNYVLYMMDLDQVEYRLFAHYAIIPGLIEAIKQGHDVHKATAAIIFKKPIEEVTDAERDKGKTVNFSLIYGQGDEALAVSLKTTVEEARRIKAIYFAGIPEARPFIMSVHSVIKARGYVRNFYKRRRRLDRDDCYKAPNALIQGCAADYIKHKIVGIYKWLKYNNLKTKMVNVVHDEIIFCVHKDEEPWIIPYLRWLLSDFTSFRVPITAGVDFGEPSWGQKTALEKERDPGFKEPEDKSYLNYNVFNGEVFVA